MVLEITVPSGKITGRYNYGKVEFVTMANNPYIFNAPDNETEASSILVCNVDNPDILNIHMPLITPDTNTDMNVYYSRVGDIIQIINRSDGQLDIYTSNTTVPVLIEPLIGAIVVTYYAKAPLDNWEAISKVPYFA